VIGRESHGPTAGARAFTLWTLRWGAWLWAAALVLAVPATWRTAELYSKLRSELEQLLPRNAPSVRAIDELRERLPSLQYLGVIVDFGRDENLQPAERMLDDLAARLRRYPPDLVKAVRTGDAVERQFIEHHAPLYMDVADLITIRDRIEARRDWEAEKETGSLLDDEPPPPLDLDDIQHKYDTRFAGSRRFDGDHFANKEEHCALILIQAGEFVTGGRGKVLFDRVQADLSALHPDSYASGMRVGFTGDIAINVEETSALVADLSLSSILVILFVVGAIFFYYQWWKSVFVLLPPLLLATTFAFALASLPPFRVDELNSNTAFLGSIIVGNGINFGIVLFARYAEARRLDIDVRESLVLAVWGSRTGTLSAALAAGVSYASLALTDFRGFQQFGFIGGIGMLLSWLLAFLLMPPLAAWVDRGPVPQKRSAIMNGIAAWTCRNRKPVVAAACALAALSVWEVRSFGPDQVETDFSKLRRADTWRTGEGYWGRRMDTLLNTYVTPTVVLAGAAPQAEAIGRLLKAQEKEPPLDRMVASVRTLDDVVPADQAPKMEMAAQIQDDLTPRVRASLSADQRKLVERWFGAAPLTPIGASTVPDTLMAGLRERDGTVGKTVLVYPRPGRSLWLGPRLIDFVSRLRAAAASVPGRAARVAGSLALSADILVSLRRDGVLASAAAFFGVVVVVIALLRRSRTTILVTGSLLLGVLWLTAAMMILRIKINFANFIAFPITFGIGVDYSVNVASRWTLDRGHSMADAVRTTGGAVTLCSMTTIIGYSSLLLAENRALFYFGLLAVLGEISCLSTAVVVMPAFVEWATPARGGKEGIPSLDPS
jgi:predicted exporter